MMRCPPAAAGELEGRKLIIESFDSDVAAAGAAQSL
jgi:hypothetical protein